MQRRNHHSGPRVATIGQTVRALQAGLVGIPHDVQGTDQHSATKPVIRRVREALGLTQEAFARGLGRSYAAIRTYEAGRKAPLDVMARAMAMCVSAGLADLANDVQGVATGTIDRAVNDVAPGSALHLHGLLDRLIRSGDADTLLVTARYLEMSAYWAKAGQSRRAKQSGPASEISA